MILTNKELNYLSELPSSVARALPNAANPDVPFFLYKNPVIRNYEMLRSVWMDEQSVKTVCRSNQFSRNQYYKLENAFVKHGVAAVYPQLGEKRQHPKLERLCLMVKTTRPRTTELTILRFAEALELDPAPSLRKIGKILHCHGIGNTRDEKDRQYWQGLQERIRAVQWLKTQQGPLRSSPRSRKSFYIPEEALQVRFELFRELALQPKSVVKDVVRRYGISRPTFYKYLGWFRLYGPWGLVERLQAGRGREKISDELELRIIEEKLERPRLSLEELMKRLKLRCSRTALYEVLRYWELMDKNRPTVQLRGLWTEEEKPVQRPQLLRTAKEAAAAGQYVIPKKINAHFKHLLKRMQSRKFTICDPGPIILAQFIDDLGVREALDVYGPKRRQGGDLTNLVLLNVCRILAGYETIAHLSSNSDRSAAIAAGMGMFPGKTMLYEGFNDLKFEHLQALRNDVAAAARDRGLIRGERIANDFHFKEFYGRRAVEEGIGIGPNSSGELCPGFRPHVVWDVDTDVLINIAFCNGSTRATKMVREFCEKNLYPILDRDALREMFMDSEYSSFAVMDYFVVCEFSHVDITMCLKRNRKIDKMIKEIAEEDKWENWDDYYEIAGKRFKIERLSKTLHMVVKRNKNTKEVRCFGTTIQGLTHSEVLERYRMRWPIENGLKDLIHSYFIDHILGKDPEKIEANFYCVQVARLAYENFLQSLDEKFVRDSKGYKRTLSSFRYLLFGRHNCEIRRRGDYLELTYLDMGLGALQDALMQLLEKRTEQGLNRVSWWGGLGLKVKFEDQYSEIFDRKCPENGAVELS